MSEAEFNIGDMVDYKDPESDDWAGPAQVVEILWSEYLEFYLYVIDSEDYASACCAQELKLHGVAVDPELEGEL
jgi:hypothetical protein